MCKKQSQYVFMRLYDKKNNKNECIIWTVGTFYSSVHIFKGMIWHVQQNVVKCLIIPLPQLSYIYWFIQFKGTSTDIEKTVFRKVLLIWSSMPIFSFIGCTLTELFRKPVNWQQIYKQTSSTFYTSNDVSRRKNY